MLSGLNSLGIVGPYSVVILCISHNSDSLPRSLDLWNMGEGNCGMQKVICGIEVAKGFKVMVRVRVKVTVTSFLGQSTLLHNFSSANYVPQPANYPLSWNILNV